MIDTIITFFISIEIQSSICHRKANKISYNFRVDPNFEFVHLIGHLCARKYCSKTGTSWTHQTVLKQKFITK